MSGFPHLPFLLSLKLPVQSFSLVSGKGVSSRLDPHLWQYSILPIHSSSPIASCIFYLFIFSRSFSLSPPASQFLLLPPKILIHKTTCLSIYDTSILSPFPRRLLEPIVFTYCFCFLNADWSYFYSPIVLKLLFLQ